MQVLLRYRGRPVTPADARFIQDLITDHPDASRRALSTKLCEAWNWRQPNGHPRDMVCRGLMLALHGAGHIEPPPVRRDLLTCCTHLLHSEFACCHFGQGLTAQAERANLGFR